MRSAGVVPSASGTSAERVAGSWNGARATGRPDASAMPLMPFVDGTSTQRPVSMARRREMFHCCVGCDVPVKLALLVCTTSICAPSWTVSRTMPS